MSDQAYAVATFTVDSDASPLVFAYQAARLAVVAEVAARFVGGRVRLDRPAPGLMLLTAFRKELSAILADLEAAGAFAPLVLDIVADGEQEVEAFAEHLRGRTDQAVVVARRAKAGPAY